MAYILKTTGEMVPLQDLERLSVDERLSRFRHAIGGPYASLDLPGGEELMLISAGDAQHELIVNHPATAVAYQVLTPGMFIHGEVVVCLKSELTGSTPVRDPNWDVLEVLPEPITFYPPFYLVKGVVTCGECGTDFLAAAILATSAVNGGENVGPAYLCNAPELPAKLRLEVQWHAPRFRKASVRNDSMEYFANACPECGAIISDQFLFQENGPFAVHNRNRASMKLLLHEEPVTVRASLEKRDGVI